MVLGFKKTFSDGTPTDFRDKIFNGLIGIIEEPIKLHSIRQGERWRAGMAIQMAYGVRTKHYQQFNEGVEELSTCVSVQAIEMDFNLITGKVNVYVDGRKLRQDEVNLLIKNDGLTHQQFVSWFFDTQNTFKGQLIHWTALKY